MDLNFKWVGFKFDWIIFFVQIRGIHGEHSESAGGVYDISNKARLGLTEFEAVKQMYDGIKHLIELEKKA